MQTRRCETIAVEECLKQLPLARGTKAKIRNLISTLFNHSRRYEWLDKNPITLVRQSTKRERSLEVLEVGEIRSLLGALDLRERTLVLLAAGTGLRMGELMGLRWQDVNFETREINVTRSIVKRVVGPCKTEASQKPIPPRPISGRGPAGLEVC